MHATSSGGNLYAGGRVPPPHPFLRSSSVPEQYDDPLFLNEDESDPFHHSTPVPPPLTPFPGSNSRSSFFNGSSRHHHHSQLPGGGGSAWRSTSYLDEAGRAGGRLGRQFSLSTELPTTSYGGYSRNHYGGGGGGNRLHQNIADSTFGRLQHHNQTSSSYGGRSPLTLGRSLQLVTGHGGGAAAGGGQLAPAGGSASGSYNFDPANYNDPNGLVRRKKTVRFNSEEWGSSGARGGGGGAGSSGGGASTTAGDCDFEDGELWMSVEDVRSGRWARWDALRQESQESQTRDSGIETGSCFTSSEDSNRGDHIHKKVVCSSKKGNDLREREV